NGAAVIADPEASAAAPGRSGLARRAKVLAGDWGRFAMAAAWRRAGREVPLSIRRIYVRLVYTQAWRRYALAPYDGRVLIFEGENHIRDAQGRSLWEHLTAGAAETHAFDAAHLQFLRDPRIVEQWTERLAARLTAPDLYAGDRPAAAFSGTTTQPDAAV
ncbi:MAG: hypothetical protein MI723_18490, partial [Caulobacterales bacterium]|nr:hypothetical protein [Caulobacterales bacterium]